jgi:DNA-binding HxlR family transcriptional regulator
MVDFDKLSKKWSKDILLILSEGTRGFKELMDMLTPKRPKISTRTLSDRLKDLEDEDLIRRDLVEHRPPRTIYRITEKGKKAVSLITEIEKL